MLDVIGVIIYFDVGAVLIEAVDKHADTIYQVLIPELATVVVKDDEVVAYGFMMPSINEVMQKGRGHIFPFGFIPYLKAMKHVEGTIFVRRIFSISCSSVIFSSLNYQI